MTSTPKRSRRAFLHGAGFALAGTALAACGATGGSGAGQELEEAPVSGADEALQRLVEGNARYVANRSIALHESQSWRVELAGAQHPFATIFSCVDSRVPPELVFDRGLGDLFVIRTAGHVIDRAVLGSLEFGVAELQIPLLLVLGHERCGAVSAAVNAVAQGSHAEADIDALVEGIRPAVEQVAGQGGDVVDSAVRANVALTVARLRETPILKEAVEAGSLRIVGARYSLSSGAVELLED